ncbi:MAG: winged helix DNA-binding domain-containing protein [Chloroflexi bacterium]|nr:MAG: winged helix DNA-binding domain-containing protein [Chloroflexota bacterium]
MAHGEIVEETIDGMTYWLPADRTSDGSASAGVYLLPPFDEYTVAYKDRGAVVAPAHAPLAASGGVFRSIIVVDGQVAGTWKAAVRKGAMEVIPSPFGGQSRIEENAVCTAAKRYSDFRGLPLAES